MPSALTPDQLHEITTALQRVTPTAARDTWPAAWPTLDQVTAIVHAAASVAPRPGVRLDPDAMRQQLTDDPPPWAEGNAEAVDAILSATESELATHINPDANFWEQYGLTVENALQSFWDAKRPAPQGDGMDDAQALLDEATRMRVIASAHWD